MPSAGRWIVAAVLVLGLAVPAAAVARPVDAVQSPAKLRSIGSLPQRAFAGDDFRLAVRVRNDSRKAVRPRLVVSLRTRKNGSGGRVVASRRVGELEAGEQALQGQGRAAERIGRRPVLRVRVRSYRRAAQLPDGGPAAQGHEAVVPEASQAAGSEAGRQAPRRPRPDRVAHGGGRPQLDGSGPRRAEGRRQGRGLQGRRRRRVAERSPRPVSRATAWSCSSTRRATSSATTSSRRSSTSSSRAAASWRSTPRSPPNPTGPS